MQEVHDERNAWMAECVGDMGPCHEKHGKRCVENVIVLIRHEGLYWGWHVQVKSVSQSSMVNIIMGHCGIPSSTNAYSLNDYESAKRFDECDKIEDSEGIVISCVEMIKVERWETQ